MSDSSALGRDEVVDGTLAEYRAFGQLLRTLDADAWGTPTRCEGWTVADVAGHVVGQLDDLANLRFAEASAPDSPDRQADRNRGRTATDLAAELDTLTASLGQILAGFDDAAWGAPIDPSFGSQSLGEGVLDLWDDTYIHSDDIRSALGQEPDRGAGLRAAVACLARRLTERSWGPATLALDGMERVDIGDGGGEVVGDPYDFVMAATGRGDPATLGLDRSVNVYG